MMVAQILLTQFPRIANSLRSIFTGSGSGVLKTGIKVGAGGTAVAVGGFTVNESLKSITSPVENLLGVGSGSISGILIIGAIIVFLFLVMKK